MKFRHSNARGRWALVYHDVIAASPARAKIGVPMRVCEWKVSQVLAQCHEMPSVVCNMYVFAGFFIFFFFFIYQTTIVSVGTFGGKIPNT